MRAESARLESRLAKLEEQLVVNKSAAAAGGKIAQQTPTSPGTPKAAADEKTKVDVAPTLEVPALTVVKLKPKKEAAPIILTDVDVQEPPDGLVSELKATPTAAADGAQSAEASAEYEKGLQALKDGNVENGIAALRTFARDWPKHPNADNAMYFTGVAQMALKDFDAAERAFQDVITRYPAGDARLDAMLKLAECRLKLNRATDAKATWEKIVSTFPGTAAATQAQARLSMLAQGKTPSTQ